MNWIIGILTFLFPAAVNAGGPPMPALSIIAPPPKFNYYVVTATDYMGNESVPSNELAVTNRPPLSLAWNYDTNSWYKVTNFTLYLGTNTGTYRWRQDCGKTLTATFEVPKRTNVITVSGNGFKEASPDLRMWMDLGGEQTYSFTNPPSNWFFRCKTNRLSITVKHL